MAGKSIKKLSNKKHGGRDNFTVVLEDLRSDFRVFGEGLEMFNQRLDRMDGRLERMDGRFDSIEVRLEAIEEELFNIKTQLSNINKTLLNKVEISRVENLERRVKYLEKFILSKK